jgi:hypothetical protein
MLYGVGLREEVENCLYLYVMECEWFQVVWDIRNPDVLAFSRCLVTIITGSTSWVSIMVFRSWLAKEPENRGWGKSKTTHPETEVPLGGKPRHNNVAQGDRPPPPASPSHSPTSAMLSLTQKIRPLLYPARQDEWAVFSLRACGLAFLSSWGHKRTLSLIQPSSTHLRNPFLLLHSTMVH